MKIKAYSYIRMSTDKQALGDSERRQVELSEQYCNNNNLELITDYREQAGISAFKGKNAAKGQLRAFINAVESGHIKPHSYLLIENIDRLSRQDVLASFKLVNEIIDLDISIVTITDYQIYNKETLTSNQGLIYILFGGMQRANSESKTKSGRLKSFWEKRAANAATIPLTSKCPFWLTLKKTTNKFELNEYEYIAKKIFELSLMGYGDTKISRYLNEHNIRYPTGLVVGWTKGYINTILKYHASYGALKTKSVPEPLKGYFPAIITEDQFNLIHQQIQQRRIKGGGNKGKFNNLFTKFLFCSCGATMFYADRNTAQYLKCYSVENKTGCNAHSWLYKDFEQSFLKYCSELNLTEIFSNEDATKQKEELRNSIRLKESKKIIKKNEYDLMVDRYGIVPDEILGDLMKASEIKKGEILALEQEISADNAKLLLTEHEANSVRFSDNVKDYYSMIQGKTAKEIYDIREKLHYSIKSITESITIHNNKYYKVGDFINGKLIDGLDNRKYKTDLAKQNYLLTDAGQRFYDEHRRQFKIKFKNGQVRKVLPFLNASRTKAELEAANNKRLQIIEDNLEFLKKEFGQHITMDDFK
jgi:DNA invertase Pin-like site-specific DNA recombinase